MAYWSGINTECESTFEKIELISRMIDGTLQFLVK